MGHNVNESNLPVGWFILYSGRAATSSHADHSKALSTLLTKTTFIDLTSWIEDREKGKMNFNLVYIMYFALNSGDL